MAILILIFRILPRRLAMPTFVCRATAILAVHWMMASAMLALILLVASRPVSVTANVSWKVAVAINASTDTGTSPKRTQTVARCAAVICWALTKIKVATSTVANASANAT